MVKVALSDVILTLLFNFERLEHHHYQSNGNLNVTSTTVLGNISNTSDSVSSGYPNTEKKLKI